MGDSWESGGPGIISRFTRESNQGSDPGGLNLRRAETTNQPLDITASVKDDKKVGLEF